MLISLQRIEKFYLKKILEYKISYLVNVVLPPEKYLYFYRFLHALKKCL